MFLLAEPRRLGMRLRDALWVRLVDVGAALSRRAYGDGGPLVIEVEDAFCPWNAGRYRLAGGEAERTDVVIERTAGALRRADAMFHGERAPWCPDTF